MIKRSAYVAVVAIVVGLAATFSLRCRLATGPVVLSLVMFPLSRLFLAKAIFCQGDS